MAGSTKECRYTVFILGIVVLTLVENELLFEIFLKRGALEYVLSDNGTEFTSTAVRKRLGNMGSVTLFIKSGSSWENEYVESLNGRMRDELLNGEIFDTLLKV